MLRSKSVLACAGKRRAHLRRPAHQRDDDEAHERGRHPKRHRGLLHRFDENLAHQRHQHRDSRECGKRQPDRPRFFAFLPMRHAAEKLAVRLERKEQAESVGGDE